MTAAPIVAVLFARSDSIYYQIPGCDVYDIERDALTFPGGIPDYRSSAVPDLGRDVALGNDGRARARKELAPWTIEQVARREGGMGGTPRTEAACGNTAAARYRTA